MRGPVNLGLTGENRRPRKGRSAVPCLRATLAAERTAALAGKRARSDRVRPGMWMKAPKPCGYACMGEGVCSGCTTDVDCDGGTICMANVSAAPKCGDGRKTGTEACDDGAGNVMGGSASSRCR